MEVLDCGCGPGTITLGLAKAVGAGQVVGIDTDASCIEQAEATATSQGIANACFQSGDVYALDFPDATFDAVFANGLLEHLSDPAQALSEMRRVLRPEGVVGIRSPDMGGQLLYPSDPLVELGEQLWVRLVEHSGGDVYVGRKLRGLLRQAGFVRIRVSAEYECPSVFEKLQPQYDSWIQDLSPGSPFAGFIDAGLTDRDTLAQIAAAWERWSQDPDAFSADSWCMAVGWVD
jgi:SAM-dependent methyltransferase